MEFASFVECNSSKELCSVYGNSLTPYCMGLVTQMMKMCTFYSGVKYFELQEPVSQHLLKMLSGGAKHMSSVFCCVSLCCISAA
uniref:SFRICE_038071 n=1 Tax=Spodoptera frugiperda TaxID=7108 RepID=A0A2H1VBW2_SPOFR